MTMRETRTVVYFNRQRYVKYTYRYTSGTHTQSVYLSCERPHRLIEKTWKLVK